MIRLWPDDPEAGELDLVVGEGIETTLTAARVFQPAWAALDADNLSRLDVLPGFNGVTVLVDDDDAGRRAAEAFATRRHAAGAVTRLWRPGHGA